MLLTLCTPVFFLKTRFEPPFDIGLRRTFTPFFCVVFDTFLSIGVSGHNYNKRVDYAHLC